MSSYQLGHIGRPLMTLTLVTVVSHGAEEPITCPKPRVVDYPSVRYLDPQLGTGHPCTRTSSVLYFLIRYLDPKVGDERG